VVEVALLLVDVDVRLEAEVAAGLAEVLERLAADQTERAGGGDRSGRSS